MNTGSFPHSDPHTVLIVDDTPINLGVVVESLEARAMRVVIAQDGLEGLQRATLVQPDLILLDIMMPGMDGLETCRRLKRDARTWDIPVIFMTSLTDTEDKVAGFRAGGVDFVCKPLQIDELIARIDTHLGLFAERKQTQALLQRREQEFRALAENAPDAIARFDREGRFLYANPALERLLARPLEQLLGRRATEVSPDWAGAERFDRQVREVGDTGVSADTQFWHELRGAQAPRAWYQVRFVPEGTANGRIATILALGRDITAIKEAERRLEDSNGQLRDLARRRENAREEERKRMAREIHDELGQHLTALRMGISLVALQFGEGHPQLVERLQQSIALTDKTIHVVRQVAASLRPAALDMGLASALEWLVGEFVKHTRVDCGLRLPDEKAVLDDERATAVFRVVQESLTNVARHAEASRVEVGLDLRGPDYIVEVRDNGKGFDPAKRKKNALGLVGIRERGYMLGGEITITSAPGEGTIVRARVPVERSTDAE